MKFAGLDNYETWRTYQLCNEAYQEAIAFTVLHTVSDGIKPTAECAVETLAVNLRSLIVLALEASDGTHEYYKAMARAALDHVNWKQMATRLVEERISTNV